MEADTEEYGIEVVIHATAVSYMEVHFRFGSDLEPSRDAFIVDGIGGGNGFSRRFEDAICQSFTEASIAQVGPRDSTRSVRQDLTDDALLTRTVHSITRDSKADNLRQVK